jgi:hypothetical protein
MIVPASNGNWQLGCWVVYMAQTDRLYLVNESSVWLNAGAPGSGSTVEDGQCSLDGAASSVGTNGNDMTVTFALSFKSGFEGSRPIRMRSQEKDTLETSAIGAHGHVHVVTDSGPQTISVSPVSGSVDVGSGIDLAATFGHSDGAGNLRRLEMVVAGPGGSWQLGCWAVYMVETNRLYLIDDNSVWLNAGAPGSANTVQDGQCILSAAGSSTSVNGNRRTVTFDLTFKVGFEGGRVIRLRAQEMGTFNFSSVSTHGTITIE